MKATRLREAARRVLDEKAKGVYFCALVENNSAEKRALDFVTWRKGHQYALWNLPIDLRAMLLLMAAAVAESDEELP